MFIINTDFHSVDVDGLKVTCTHNECNFEEYFPTTEDAYYAKIIHEDYRREE